MERLGGNTKLNNAGDGVSARGLRNNGRYDMLVSRCTTKDTAFLAIPSIHAKGGGLSVGVPHERAEHSFKAQAFHGCWQASECVESDWEAI